MALDVATVIVFVQIVAHTLPEVTGVAVAMNHAPGVLAAAQILLEHGPGIVASVRGGLDQIDRLNNVGDAMQAQLRSGAQAEVTQPQDLPATEWLPPQKRRPAPAPAQQAQADRPAAAAKPAAGTIFSNSAATIGLAGQAAWQALRSTGQQAAATAGDGHAGRPGSAREGPGRLHQPAVWADRVPVAGRGQVRNRSTLRERIICRMRRMHSECIAIRK